MLSDKNHTIKIFKAFDKLLFYIIGYLATGQYFVSLPDGRLQTVTYHADANGYVADVQYTGEAVYVAPKPTYAP
jgi:hypothetical protein